MHPCRHALPCWYQGLFGFASRYAKIHDLTLADIRITGHNYVGGIVGNNYSDITNCHVTPTVAIHAVQADASSHGGIVGYGQYGNIYYSTSGATLTTADATQSSSYGAIVGHNQNGYVKHCIAIGATVPAAKDNTYGAVCGDSYKFGDYPISIEANYYINCTVAGTANATGVGINGANLTTGTTKRIVPAYAITTGNAENFSIAFDEGTVSAGGGFTFYDAGFKYDDVLYAAAGQTVSGSAYHGGLVGYAINAAFEGCAFTGADAGKAASGNLTLIWTDVSDYVKCSSYSVENILFSKQFVTAEKETIATASNIAGEQ